MLVSSAVWSQSPEDPVNQRLFSLGIKAGPAHEVAHPTENVSGYYASDRAIFDFGAYRLGLDAQLMRLNDFGAAVDVGYRQYAGSLSREKSSNAFQGTYAGEFRRSSLYVRPAFLYNRMLGERWMIIALAGLEWQANLDGGSQLYYRDQYRYDSQDFYTLLSLGTEIRTWLDNSVSLSFYLNYSHGWKNIASLYQEAIPGESGALRVGDYRGRGVDLGFKLSYCFSCAP